MPPRLPCRGLRAALVDVGGTLWPNHWPPRDSDAAARVGRVRGVLEEPLRDHAPALVDELLQRVDRGLTEPLAQQPDRLIGVVLRERGLPTDATRVRQVRHALCLDIDGRFEPLPGAEALLSSIKEAGLRCVILSNTGYRDGEVYRRDFVRQGLDRYIDAYVTSVDVGYMKPHPAMFQAGLQAAAEPAAACVMIGNSEHADIEPADALGMRTILVAVDDPEPVHSRAGAVVLSLSEAADRVVRWARE